VANLNPRRMSLSINRVAAFAKPYEAAMRLLLCVFRTNGNISSPIDFYP